MDTIEVTIDLNPKDPWSEILIAELAENGFDSFVTTDSGIKAYASADIFVASVLEQTILSRAPKVEYSISSEVIPYQNWNAVWEANFKPVHIDDVASILAPFHDRAIGKGVIVEIQPQMSFGTGHHETTWMMVKAMFAIKDFPSNVLDMGAGTGVLAIFAEKLGARAILAVDNDEGSVRNALENGTRNKTNNIEFIHGGIKAVKGKKFGLIIANINKNILKEHMETYVNILEADGVLLLSGFLCSDVDEMVKYASSFDLSFLNSYKKNEWAGIQFQKSN